MSLQTTININVDFYDNKYMLINAKQNDSSSRWISVACYNQGELMNLNSNKHTAYIRYKKADEYGVLNTCRINYRGEVLIELTEQMLASDGICYVDLIIVNKGSAVLNIDTGEVITIDDSPILSTMAFCVNVYETAFDNSLIESSYEYDALNDLLQRADADYKEVIQLSRSYAIGDANDVRENEDFDNSKYYSQLSKSYAMGDADGVRENENVDNSKYYYQLALASAEDADESEANAKSHMDDAQTYMNNANEHMNNAKTYMDNAKTSEENALTSEKNAKASAEDADESESNALSYATLSQRYAVGNTNTVEGEDTDNAEYYYKLAKSYTIGNTDGIRENEDEDNAKYYYELAQVEANNAVESENNAKTYMDNAKSYMDSTKTYMDTTKTYMDNASDSADSADISKANAAESANRAADVADSIVDSVKSAEDNAKIALDSATSASEDAENASESAASALNSASSASESAASALQNYTETNYLYLQTKEIATGLNGAFSPKGTIEFSELATLSESGEVKAGDLYNISDAFTTDDTFKRVGIECAVGTNVYYTSDGYWDCLAAGTVNGVKGDNELEYRQGNVNITAENVGAIPSTDMATVDEVKSYLGI